MDWFPILMALCAGFVLGLLAALALRLIQSRTAKELADERDECWKIANEYTKEFIIQLLEELKVISSLQVPVMIGIRKELDIDTNFENYEKLIKENSEILKNQINEFLVSLNGTA